jgi:hypothetical protein
MLTEDRLETQLTWKVPAWRTPRPACGAQQHPRTAAAAPLPLLAAAAAAAATAARGSKRVHAAVHYDVVTQS